jgi:hypothetical protein
MSNQASQLRRKPLTRTQIRETIFVRESWHEVRSTFTRRTVAL